MESVQHAASTLQAYRNQVIHVHARTSYTWPQNWLLFFLLLCRSRSLLNCRYILQSRSFLFMECMVKWGPFYRLQECNTHTHTSDMKARFWVAQLALRSADLALSRLEKTTRGKANKSMKQEHSANWQCYHLMLRYCSQYELMNRSTEPKCFQENTELSKWALLLPGSKTVWCIKYKPSWLES